MREIKAHLEELYGLRVSSALISRSTDALLDEVCRLKNRAQDRMYPIVIFNALRVKILYADSRMVNNTPACIALDVIRDRYSDAQPVGVERYCAAAQSANCTAGQKLPKAIPSPMISVQARTGPTTATTKISP